jgi:multidrug resistance efflux pump
MALQAQNRGGSGQGLPRSSGRPQVRAPAWAPNERERSTPSAAGDVIARIDDRDYRIALDQAQAQVASAELTANFKETQLDAMRPGQPVTLAIDAYPERVIRGHVASVQPGSGTAFSLLPAQNATGNYVKIVQRVPVKVVMDNPPTDVALGPGMSVVPTVRVNPAPSIYERLLSRYEHLRAWV